MAAGNLVVKLLLDSNAFDTNIKSAKAQIQGLEKVGKSITSVLGKFAGGIGIATTAIGAFNQIMKSSQTTSDFLDQQMRILTNSVDGFFTAIATGDFSYMSRGFDEIKRKAKEAQQAIDQLGNTTMSYNYFTSKNDVAFADALQKAKDKTLDKDTREAAKATATAIIGEQSEISEVMSQTLDEVLRKTVTEKTAGLGWLQVSKADMERILQIDVMRNRDSEKARLEKEYEEYTKAREEAAKWVKENQRHNYTTIWGYNKLVDKRMESQGITSEKYKDAILYQEMLVKNGDDWLNNLIKIAKEYDNVMRKIVTMKQQMNEVNGMDLSKGVATSTTKAVTSPAVEGSLRQLDEQIANIKKQMRDINVELNPDKYRELQTKLKELEDKKLKIEYELTPHEKHGAVLTGNLANLQIGGSVLKLPEPKDVIKTATAMTSATTAVYEYGSSLQYLANIMQASSNAISNYDNKIEANGANMLAWAANTTAALGTAIEACRKLVAAKTAEAAANAGAEASKLPVVGWLAAGAAIASVIAAFASIPKFTNGGVINSPFTSGDKVLARVNGGEMILNKNQQANLFSLLDRGGAIANNQVSFKISGKELVGVINNYNNRLSKAL